MSISVNEIKNKSKLKKYFGIELEKLNIEDGDIVVIKGTNIDTSFLEEVSKLGLIKANNNLIIALDEDSTISSLSEEDMNQMGWYKDWRLK